jgi:hypothetical protein
LKALYKSEDWEMPTEEADVPAEEPDAEQNSFKQIATHLQAALEIITQMMPSGEPETEVPPVETAELAETFAEISVSPVRIVEAETPADRRLPLTLDVGIIKVGPGNKRDNHYYTREMLERDGKIFEGLTMHTVDHREDMRSEGTDVSTVEEILGIRDFADGAYLVGRVVAYDPNFCEKTRNRAIAKKLDKLQCSILASGEAQPGEVDGKQYNIVTGITEGKFVDWVTRSGAGGHAMAIAESAAPVVNNYHLSTGTGNGASSTHTGVNNHNLSAANGSGESSTQTEPESETETQESEPATPKPVTLSEDAEPETEPEQAPAEEVIQSLPLAEVIAALGNTNLPASSVAELASGLYHESSELEQAITVEVRRLKAAGSGAPLGIGTPQRPQSKSIREIQAEQQAVNRKWLR